MTKRKKYPDYFTVGDLKKLLRSVPDHLPIGTSGHFGEFNMMYEDSFYPWKARLIPASGKWQGSWRGADDHQTEIFEIVCPHLGSDPS